MVHCVDYCLQMLSTNLSCGVLYFETHFREMLMCYEHMLHSTTGQPKKPYDRETSAGIREGSEESSKSEICSASILQDSSSTPAAEITVSMQHSKQLANESCIAPSPSDDDQVLILST